MSTLDEAKRVLKADALEELDEAVVEERFRIVGGDLRALMRPQVFNIVEEKIYRTANDTPHSKYFLAACAQKMLILLDIKDDSSTLLCYESTYPFVDDSTYVGFVSDYVRKKLRERK
jgi:hypothetical protein